MWKKRTCAVAGRRQGRARRRVRRAGAGGAAFAVAAILASLGGPHATPDAPAAGQPPKNTKLPAITGTARDGETLTADPGEWMSTTALTFAYSWLRCEPDGSSCAGIAGATQQTYRLVGADVGRTMRVQVTATNSSGSRMARSNPSPVVAAAPPASTQPPVVSGTPRDGETLTSSPGTWAGTPPFTFQRQWQRCDAAGEVCAPIAGATAATYVLTGEDVDSTVRVSVTAINAAGRATATSAPTAVVANRPVCGSASAPSGARLVLCLQTYPTRPLDNRTNVPGSYTATSTTTGITSTDSLGCPGQRMQASKATPCLTWTLDGAYALTDLWPPLDMRLYPGFYAAGTYTVTATAHVSGVPVSVSVPLTIAGSSSVVLPRSPRSGGAIPTVDPALSAVTVAAVGDGAAGQASDRTLTKRIAGWSPNLLFYLGDVYQIGSYQEYMNYFDPADSYGRFAPITVATGGNHEFGNTHLPDWGFEGGRAHHWYFDYLKGAPTEPGRGASYFSFDLPNAWHVIVLNSEIPLSATSPQTLWLRDDIAAHPDSAYPCTIAVWHRPRWSSATIRGDGALQPFWDRMTNSGVDIYLNAHAHVYERTVPLNNDGSVNSSGRGVVQLTVGTGGNGLGAFRTEPTPWVAFRSNTVSGALKLVLDRGRARYEFVGQYGTVADAGAIPCRTGDVAAPTVPTGLTAASVAEGVRLTWTASKDNVAVAGYLVYRNGVRIASTGTTASYTDTAAPRGTTVTYTVRARDQAGNESGLSAPATITVPA